MTARRGSATVCIDLWPGGRPGPWSPSAGVIPVLGDAFGIPPRVEDQGETRTTFSEAALAGARRGDPPLPAPSSQGCRPHGAALAAPRHALRPGVMHEYGIVRDLLSVVDEHVRAQARRRAARAVRVVLGVTGATAPQEHLLRAAFDAFKAGTSADQAELVLERAPLEVCCLSCGHLAESANGQCPLCGGDTVLPARVQDIFLISVEIEG